MILEKYSLGIGDRFAQQGEAQLKAILKAQDKGINIVPVWNKSNREHEIIQSGPAGTESEASQATEALGCQGYGGFAGSGEKRSESRSPHEGNHSPFIYNI